MTKSIHQKSSISIKSKRNTQTKKYTCGCGKTYTSYPAYSTHRKSKHNNVNIEGTFIPKPENPKRGRPSYEFVKKNEVKTEKLKNYYQGLTVIQLGLLKLNERFQGKILSQSHQSNQFNLPQELVALASHDSDKTNGEDYDFDPQKLQNQVKRRVISNNSLVQAKLMILFVELMTTHMAKAPAQALIEFISEFLIYSTTTQKLSLQSEEQLDHDEDNKDIFDITLFNKYFSRVQNKQHINQLSANHGLKTQFFVDISVILSHWIYKLGYCEKVIKIKQVERSGQEVVYSY